MSWEQIGMWVGIVTGGASILSFAVGAARWAWSIHRIGTDALQLLQVLSNSMRKVKRVQRGLMDTVDQHGKILKEHKITLDKHEDKIRILTEG